MDKVTQRRRYMSNEHAQYRHCTKMSIYIHYVRHVTIVIGYEITGVIDLIFGYNYANY